MGKSALANAFLTQENLDKNPVRKIDLLHSESYETYLKNPELLRFELEKALSGQTAAPLSVLIDEVQRIPALLNEVHSLLETHRGKIRFLLTGSSARKLKREGANLLAGRAFTLRLHPLTSDEWPQDLADRLVFGSLPGIAYAQADDKEAQRLSLRSYVSTYLREEIQQEALVRRLDAFARFLEVAGQYHSKTINAASIAKAAGVSAHTIAEYLQILEDTLIAVKLPGWNASSKKQLRTTPKLYFFDNGVVNALRGELNIAVKESSSRYGELFEGTVIQELMRANDYEQWDLRFSYWRTNNGAEVDLIVSRGAGPPLAAIEIKSARLVDRKDFHGLLSFQVEWPNVPCYCICRATQKFRHDEGIEIVPWEDVQDLLRQLSQSS